MLSELAGNTWAYGIGADPFRTSTFREISRVRSKWIDEGKMDPFDPQFKNFNRRWISDDQRTKNRLMKIPEHNWGLSDYKYLNHTEYTKIWSNSDFWRFKNDEDFTLLAEGWAEARSYLFNYRFLWWWEKIWYFYSLPHDLQRELEESLDKIKPRKPSKLHLTSVWIFNREFHWIFSGSKRSMGPTLWCWSIHHRS